MIYDGDALAFRAAAAIEKRTVKATHIKSGRSKIFKTQTELKKLVESKGKVFSKEDYLLEPERESLDVSVGSNIVRNQIEQINSQLFADEYLICLSGKMNFRDALPLPTKYKSSRAVLERPEHLKALKTYLWRKHPSLLADNHEADDDLIIKGYEYLAKGYTVILAQQDKDAFAYSGLNVYDFTQEQPVVHLLPEFGSLWLETKLSGVKQTKVHKVRGEGFIWFCFQWLNGDPTDDYKPCELSGVKFGEKSAYDLLVNCTTDQEALQVVVDKYKEWYPVPFAYTCWEGKIYKADYKTILQLYYSCAKMMQTEDDPMDALVFLSDKGIDL